MVAPFPSPRDAALALLNDNAPLTRKAGSFLGQVCVDPTPLSEAQQDWLDKLLAKRGLPPVREAA